MSVRALCARTGPCSRLAENYTPIVVERRTRSLTKFCADKVDLKGGQGGYEGSGDMAWVWAPSEGHPIGSRLRSNRIESR